MSLKLGNIPISGISQNIKYNAHHLLDFKWTDCIMNDVSWLRADTFSWQSGDVYTSAYNHLVADLQGATSETETIGSYTIAFYRATDGHKITTDETTVANIYNETGIAWYYILDTANTRFKLPRSTYNAYSKKLPVVGNGNALGTNTYVPTLANTYQLQIWQSQSGGYSLITASGASSNSGVGISTDPDESGIIAQSETLDNMYLYFYVGDYTQTAIEQTAGLNSELFNGKADVDLANTSNKLSELFVNKLMPDYSAGINITGTSYTSPAYGFINVHASGGVSGWVLVNGARVGVSSGTTADSTVQFLVSKGDEITLRSGYNFGTTSYFYPLKGVN